MKKLTITLIGTLLLSGSQMHSGIWDWFPWFGGEKTFPSLNDYHETDAFIKNMEKNNTLEKIEKKEEEANKKYKAATKRMKLLTEKLSEKNKNLKNSKMHDQKHIDSYIYDKKKIDEEVKSLESITEDKISNIDNPFFVDAMETKTKYKTIKSYMEKEYITKKKETAIQKLLTYLPEERTEEEKKEKKLQPEEREEEKPGLFTKLLAFFIPGEKSEKGKNPWTDEEASPVEQDQSLYLINYEEEKPVEQPTPQEEVEERVEKQLEYWDTQW